MENTNEIKFTDLCQNNIDCKKCKYNNVQCFGVGCPDFEPFITDLSKEI